MADSKITITPLGHRASWARDRTEFDPPLGDSMQGASEPNADRAERVAGPTVKHACDRLNHAVDELVEVVKLISHLAQLAPNDFDRATMRATVEHCGERLAELEAVAEIAGV